MSTQNFKIKNGLSIGDNEIIDSSGNLTLPTGATINVGGAPLDALPEQSGQSGKYLSTDGTDASWETITQYTPPTDQGSGNFLAGDGTYKTIDVSTDIATAVAALVDSAPSTLDTLNELAASLGDDANFATSVSTSLGTKVDKTTTVNGHALSGNVTVTKSDVSLGNVDNTSDASKPVSTATQTALDLKANLASPTFTGTVSGITKTMVGLSNADNTADSAKPVSTAQQTALDLKVSKVSSTDNAVVRFDGTTGQVQNSSVVIDDSGNVGIGTSSPGQKVEVVGGNIKVNSADESTIITSGGNFTTGAITDSAIMFSNNLLLGTGISEKMRIDSSGNVGIGVTPSAWGSSYKSLGVEYYGAVSSTQADASINLSSNTYYNGTNWIYKETGVPPTLYKGTSTGYKWYTAPSGTAGNPITWNSAMTLDTSGNLTASGNVTAYSDEKLKENIITINNALEKTLQLRGVYYNKKQDELKTKKLGVIAQEVQKIIPEVVLENSEGTLSVDYGNIVGLLIEAIKEQQIQIEELKSKIKG